jgi:hypothetical protein
MDLSSMGNGSVLSQVQRDRSILWLTASWPYPKLTEVTTLNTSSNTSNNKIPPANRQFCPDLAPYFEEPGMTAWVKCLLEHNFHVIIIKGSSKPTQMHSRKSCPGACALPQSQRQSSRLKLWLTTTITTHDWDHITQKRKKLMMTQGQFYLQ